MSVITSISEFTDREGHAGSWMKYDGWEVVCDDHTVTVAISNSQDCCENWGYFNSEDDPQKYLGAEMIRVERVTEDETQRLVTTIPDLEYGLDAGGAVFVNVVTDRGTFQLAAYNAHNGYYGHEAVVISRDVKTSETL